MNIWNIYRYFYLRLQTNSYLLLAGLIEKFIFPIPLFGLYYIYSWPQAPKGFLPCGCLPSSLETCQISELCNFTHFTPHSSSCLFPLALFQSMAKLKYNPFAISCHGFSPTSWLHLPKHVYTVSQSPTDWKWMWYSGKKITSLRCIAPIRVCGSSSFNTF